MHVRMAPLVLVLPLLLAGCEPPSPTSAELIVAKVGREAITEGELNRALSRMGTLSETERLEARGKVLDALVDQRLISNEARRTGLDKEAEVLQALLQVQQQILIEAYVGRMFKDVAPPTDAEIRGYYAQHPELFAARKVYRIQELDLQMASTRVAEVEARLKLGRHLADFGEWLKSQGIASKAGVVIKPAEQLPVATLALVRKMQDGQVTVLATGPESISVLQLQGSQTQPMALEQARAVIEETILNEKRKSMLADEIKRLRSNEKIAYASGFTPATVIRNADTPSGQGMKP